MKKLKFECQGCKTILVVSDAGMGKGKHEDFCNLVVTHKCACGYNFSGTYLEIKTMLMEHLIKECIHILCAATRRLMRLINRFEELKLPKKMIEWFKKEPFYYLQQESDAWSSYEPKEYATLF